MVNERIVARPHAVDAENGFSDVATAAAASGVPNALDSRIWLVARILGLSPGVRRSAVNTRRARHSHHERNRSSQAHRSTPSCVPKSGRRHSTSLRPTMRGSEDDKRNVSCDQQRRRRYGRCFGRRASESGGKPLLALESSSSRCGISRVRGRGRTRPANTCTCAELFGATPQKDISACRVARTSPPRPAPMSQVLTLAGRSRDQDIVGDLDQRSAPFASPSRNMRVVVKLTSVESPLCMKVPISRSTAR